LKFSVLASGYGSNLQAIINSVKRKKIKAKLVLVLSDRQKAFALTRAQRAKIKAVYVNPKSFKTRNAFDKACLKFLKKEKVDFIVLAGYMRILSPGFIKAYRNRIINIHPALLPAFKGVRGAEDALNYGAKVTGVTVHFVDETC